MTLHRPLATAVATLGLLLAGATVSAEQVSLYPLKDNTLYESATGARSNGSGSRVFAGRAGSGSAQRAVIAFDVAGNVPACSTIDSATLYLIVVQTSSGPQTVSLHRLLADWGEGPSVAGGGQGGGAPAEPGDATWIHTFYDTGFWSEPGGDFFAAPSASAEVDSFGPYAWGPTFEMADDVQRWLDAPDENFGWIAIGNEEPAPTSKAFGSHEDTNGEAWPLLEIVYTPAEPGSCDDDAEEDSESDVEDDDPDAGGFDDSSGLLTLGVADDDAVSRQAVRGTRWSRPGDSTRPAPARRSRRGR